MIHDALQHLVNELNTALKSIGGTRSVFLGNIAQVESERKGELRQVVLSLINVEPETALQNDLHSRPDDGKAFYENRPMNLNLYLLFSANNSDYPTALKSLASVIEFFQRRNVFTACNSPDLEGVSRTTAELADFRLTMEFQSLSLEQINHLWGSLGGKQVPFVLYRARLVNLSVREVCGSGPPIKEIFVDTNDGLTH